MSGFVAQIVRGVPEQSARGTDRLGKLPAAEAVQGNDSEVGAQKAVVFLKIEFEGVQLGEEHLFRAGERPLLLEFLKQFPVDEGLPDVEAPEFGVDLLPGAGEDEELAHTDIKQSQRIRTALVAIDGGGVGVDPGVEQRPFGHGPRGDDPGDLALDDALGQLRVLHLVGDGHLEPRSHQFGQVAFEGVVGEPAHGDPLTFGHDQIQRGADLFRVFEELLVEVPQPEEQDRVGRDGGLGLPVLAHHGSEFFIGGFHLANSISTRTPRPAALPAALKIPTFARCTRS